MREIRSPLDGILSPFAARAAVDAYAVQGLSPLLVADFTTPYYRKAGSTSTFDSTFTHSRAGNATIVDSDGLIKWAPHNFVLRSQEFNLSPWQLAAQGSGITPTVTPAYATAPDGSSTAARLQCSRASAGGGDRSRLQQSSISYSPIGSQVTRGLWVKSTDGSNQVVQIEDSSENFSGITATVGADWQFIEVTYDVLLSASGNIWIGLLNANTSALTTDILIWGAHAYRSDLGGMVNNPDRGDSYVPTTSAAVYQARRNHHTWNGSAWVNSGLLLETEARTNLVTDSNDFSAWTTQDSTKSTNTLETTDPSGNNTAIKLESTVSTNPSGIYRTQIPVTTGNTLSLYAKIGTSGQWVGLSNEGGGIGWAYFDLVNGAVGFSNSCEPFIVPVGGGWYRIGLGNSQYTSASGSFFLVSLEGSNLNDNPWSIGNSVAGDVVYLWGPQLEQAPTLSSYMPTAGATFTRPTESLQIAAADMPWNASNVSLQMNGKITYADEGVEAQQTFARWYDDANNYITIDLDTDSTDTGEVNFEQQDGTGGTGTVTADTYSPGILVPYNIASRNTSTAINGATDGTAGTEDTTPTVLPDLSAKDFSLGYDYMGTIAQFRAWNVDIGDAGIAEASS